MKIKSHVAYYLPLLILFLLVLTVEVSVPPESASVQACKRYASCIAISLGVPNWLDFR
jgi:hypothetical protein